MITLIFPYYNAPNMLEMQLEQWKLYDNAKVVLVDDGSKKYPALPVLQKSNIDNIEVELYRIEQDIPWNVSGALNLGFMNAEGWCFSGAIDHIMPVKVLFGCSVLQKNKKMYYRFGRMDWLGENKTEWIKGQGNLFLMHKELFLKTGGYDEDMAGWYGGTGNLFRRQLNRIAKEQVLPYHLLRVTNHIVQDAEAELGRQGSKYDYKNDPAMSRKVMKKRKRYNPKNPLRFDWELQWKTKVEVEV